MQRDIKWEFIYFPPFFRKWDYDVGTAYEKGKEIYLGQYPPFKKGKLAYDIDSGEVTDFMYLVKEEEHND